MPQPLVTLTATAVPLPVDNIDTDQVIPARFLKVTSKAGLGDALFADLKADGEGKPVADFPLNQPQYQGGKILVAGDNFGCGSSREHAPWALVDYGFRVILAASFADIFNNNALKNGLLPIALPMPIIKQVLAKVAEEPDGQIHVDVALQTVTFPDGWSIESQSFEIPAFRKTCLMNGVDEIGFSLEQSKAITVFEATYNKICPPPTTYAV